MSRQWRLLLAGVAATSASLAVADLALAQPREPKVVATIRPIHSLVATVMHGTGTPHMLVDGVASPHTFVLKPSDAKLLAESDIVFRVSEGLEPFTVKLSQALPKRVRLVTMIETPGLTLHALRRGATFESHGHDHGHGKGHKRGSKHEAAQGADGHIWLDPENAKVMAMAIAETLASSAPAHADRFRANAAAFSKTIDTLAPNIADKVAPLSGRSYLVFHDAYQYFEQRFGLRPVGSVTVSPDVPASAKRISALRKKVAELGAVCVFAEPQFAPKVIEPIVEGTAVRRGTLDPLGAGIPAGPDHYAIMMRALADDLRACLAHPL
jgi:zinc transport system substrate-binding protein